MVKSISRMPGLEDRVGFAGFLGKISREKRSSPIEGDPGRELLTWILEARGRRSLAISQVRKFRNFAKGLIACFLRKRAKLIPGINFDNKIP